MRFFCEMKRYVGFSARFAMGQRPKCKLSPSLESPCALRLEPYAPTLWPNCFHSFMSEILSNKTAGNHSIPFQIPQVEVDFKLVKGPSVTLRERRQWVRSFYGL